MKVSAILDSPNYETLTVDKLFSKLKSTEIDHQTRAKLDNPSAKTMALVIGIGGSSSLTNTSQSFFALSFLVSVSEEQLEVLLTFLNIATRFCVPRNGARNACWYFLM